jgi:hypothetical protein
MGRESGNTAGAGRSPRFAAPPAINGNEKTAAAEAVKPWAGRFRELVL